jgi:hypothetical protein
VNELTEIVGVLPDPPLVLVPLPVDPDEPPDPEVPVLLLELELPHAATAKQATIAAATRKILLFSKSTTSSFLSLATPRGCGLRGPTRTGRNAY